MVEECVTYLDQVVRKLRLPFTVLGFAGEVDHPVAGGADEGVSFCEQPVKLVVVALKLVQLLFEPLVVLFQLQIISVLRAATVHVDAPEDHRGFIVYGVDKHGLVAVTDGLVLHGLGWQKLRLCI